MEMIKWLRHYLETDDTKIIYILSLILIASLVDFLIGWIKARFLPDIQFSSSRAIYGIARKITLFILLVIFIPFSLLLPNEIGLTALYILYTGYLATEIFSIIGHVKEGSDDKSIDLFYNFLSKFFGSDMGGDKQ